MTTTHAGGIYKQIPLPALRALRLLILHPGEGPIHCTLEAFAWPDLPAYQALSYAWAKNVIPQTEAGAEAAAQSTLQQAMFSVTCNGINLPVTENLHDALRQFRQTPKDSFWWVDAICIDQANTQERSAQVSMMGNVYSGAKHVTIWLGQEDADTQVAMSVITSFARVMTESEADFDTVVEKAYAFNHSLFYTESGINPPSMPQWHSLIRFLNRSWFRRAWVLQEQALAQESTMLCGSQSIDKDDVCNFVAFLHTSGWHNTLSQIHIMSVKPQHKPDFGIGTLMQMFVASVWHNERPGISEIRCLFDDWYGTTNADERKFAFLANFLHTTRPFEATDDRDKVYAPLALVSTFMATAQDFADWVIPDYDKSTQEIYTDTAALLLQKLPTLHILSHVEDRAQRLLSRLPSWVPDYSHPFVFVLPFTTVADYNATKHWKSYGQKVQYDSSARTIQVRGVFKDVVAALAPGTWFELLEAHSVEPLFDLVSQLPSRSVDGQSPTESLWRTMIGDFTDRKSPASERVGASFGHLMQYEISQALTYYRSRQGDQADLDETDIDNFFARLKAYEDFARSESILRSRSDIIEYYCCYQQAISLQRERGNILPGQQAGVFDAEFEDELVAAMREFQALAGPFSARRLMRTDGNNLGLAPYSSRIGDSVCFIHSAKVPFILRQIEGNRYELVGEAYIHGLMHGQFCKLAEEQELEMQDIVLS